LNIESGSTNPEDYQSNIGLLIRIHKDHHKDNIIRILNEEVYVEQPKEFIDPSFPNHVFKLRKALYGLKHAPKVWYERFPEFLVNNGYNKGDIDKILFVKNDRGELMVAQIYVYVIVFGGMSNQMWNILSDKCSLNLK